MSIRDTQSNPRIWEKLTWSDMTTEEQGYWAVLGWQQARWDNNDAPPSADKEWCELTMQEQRAAAGLGFTEAVWNGTEDE